MHIDEFFYESQHIGWGFDPWYAGNEGFWDINQYNYDKDYLERIGFTGETSPSTFSNNMVETGIRIDSIGNVGERMNFQISFENKEGKFPVSLTTANKNIGNPVIIDLNIDDESNEIVAFADKMYIYDNSGNVLSSSDYIIESDKIDTTIALYENNFLYVINESSQDNAIYFTKYSIAQNGTIEFNDSSSYKKARLTSNVVLAEDKLFFAIAANINYMIVHSFSSNENLEYQLGYEIVKLIGDKETVIGFNTKNDLIMNCSTATGLGQSIRPFQIKSDNVVFGYINDNEDMDCITTNNNSLKVIFDFKSEDSKEINTSINCYTLPVISDIDGDGKNEIIVGTKDKIYVLNEYLIIEENFPVSLPNLFTGKKFGKDILTSDINGDGILDIITAIENVGIIAFNKSGRVIKGFPKASITPETYTMSLINSDNQTALVFLSNQNYGLQLNALTISENSLSEKGWTSYGYNGNTFVYPHKSDINIITSKNILEKKKTFCWPNPVDGNTTNIRYYVNKECEIKIDIFDIAGDFVQSLSDDSPNILDYDEIVWNVSDIQSGVYFAIVKAEKSGKIETKTIKIMVVK